jgi:hypothetical protein
MFHNKQPSDAFKHFLKMMGSTIDLTKWTGYRGDMGKEGNTLHTNWNKVDGTKGILFFLISFFYDFFFLI